MSPEQNPQNSVDTQISHSGKGGLELPSTEFGSTSLEQANAQGLINTPDTVADGFTHAPLTTGEIPKINIPVFDKPEVKKGKNKKPLMIGAGVAGAAALLAVGIGIGTSSHTKTAPQEQESSAPHETSGVEVPPVETPAPNPVDIPGEQVPGNTQEVLVQTISIEAMEAMSIDEFAQLPYADRAAYFYTKIPNMPYAETGAAFDPTAVPGFYWQQIEQTAIGQANVEDGAKMISTLAYYVTNKDTGETLDSYMDTVNSILSTGGAGVGISTSMVYVANGEKQSGLDRDGNPIEFTNITYDITDRTTGDFISETTAQVFEIPIALEDGRTIITYPRGYTIDGKQSPVAEYPY